MKTFYSIVIVFLLFISCDNKESEFPYQLVDQQATQETKALFANLYKLQSDKKIIFGQQDATVYGREWKGDDNKSDVKDVTGSHPALLGLDFSGIEIKENPDYENRRNSLIKYTKEAYEQGNIVTYCWHMCNPNNGGSFYWEKDSLIALPRMLPDSILHETYKRYLDNVASLVNDLKGKDNELIPIIFRPFHEFDGEWFWWGKGHCTKDEFIELWKFTINYLKDEKKIRNFIYAFSPDCKFNSKEEFLEYYPGDEYVDILGMDNYWDFRADGGNNPELAKKKLKIVADLAKEKNKIAALTETGLEGVVDSSWYTQVLYPILSDVEIAYAQVWRNAYESTTHYYTPTKGHPAEKDFIEFSNKDNIIFSNKLPNMYQ